MYRIGVDIGGTTVKAGVVACAGGEYKILGSAALPARREDPDANVRVIAETARLACESAGLPFEKMEGVGVDTPGFVDSGTGVILYACNLGMSAYPLGDRLSRILGVPVRLANDANAAALGEARAGAARGCKNLAVVTLGTGVGGGILIDGKIYDGANSYGGEIGHMVIVRGGEPCGCGRKGCFEAYVSATALIRQTKAAMRADKSSAMWRLAGGLARVSGKTAFEGLRLGDAAAAQVVGAYIGYLATGLANLSHILQPERILLGGGVSGAGGQLLEPLRKAFDKELCGGVRCELGLCALGNNAGIIGAACL